MILPFVSGAEYLPDSPDFQRKSAGCGGKAA
jgi:hypothetical protein